MQYRRRVAVVVAIVAVIAGAMLWHREHAATAPAPGPAGSTARAGGGRALQAREQPGRRIQGVVLLEDAPAPGVSVHIDDGQVVTSDAAGHFDFGVQRISTHVVVAESPHVTGAFAVIDLEDPTEDADHVELVMHACTASLHGTVRDAAGGPIAHARVALATDDSSLGAGGEAADDGSYDVCLPEGRQVLAVAADGYARLKTSVVVAGRVRRDFLLVPEAPVIGRVVRAQDGTPVPGATVSLNVEGRGEYAANLVLTAVADETGRFRITGAPPGRHALTATADHLTTATEVPVVAELGVPPEEVICELVAAASIDGRVTSRGKAVAGGSVYLQDDYTDLSATTRADGSFTIERVRPGHYTIAVSNYRLRTPVKVDVASADVSGIVLDLSPMASVAGRVTRDGKPVEGASVQTDGGNASTDGSGTFEIDGLAAGDHKLYAESRRLGAFTPGPTITLADGEQRTGVEVALDLSASVAGTVVDQDGAPVSGVVVNFSLLHGVDQGEATTGEDGTFTATALAGGGSYVYEVKSPAFGSYPLADGRRLVPIAVRDGRTHVTGVRIRVRRERNVIAGHVTTTAGAPLADATVRGERRQGLIERLPAVTTDASGAFRFDDVPAGSYVITASTPHGEESATKIAAGRTDVVIQIPEAASIDGTLEGFTEPPSVHALRTAGYASFLALVNGNTFTIRAIPPGEYTVFADHISETVTVTAGGHASVVLRKPGNGSIAGHLVDEHRAPLAGIECQYMMDVKTTDADGRFRVDDVPAGKRDVICHGTSFAYGEVMVVEGQVATLELTATKMGPQSRSGMELEQQFENIVVKAVESGGPAERAGIQVGDVLLTAAGGPVYAIGQIERLPAGSPVTLVLERGDKQLTVSLTLAPR